jgi:GNAT superfamily N-acetyltransferase
LELIDRALLSGESLARRLEDTETAVAESCLRAWVRRHPELGGTSAPLAGGRALFFGAVSPLSQALGVGMNGPVSGEDFDRLEAFFRARSAPVVISLSPMCDPTVLGHLYERRYRVTHFENTLVRTLARGEEPPAPGGVRRADFSERDRFTRLVMSGFADGDTPGEELAPLFTSLFEAESASAWMALGDDGQPAGGGMISVFGRSAMLYGDATLPRYRGAGLQSALIRARLRQATLAGCDLAIACTLPGSTSQRNYERAGFRVAYTKSMWVRDFA